MDNDFESVQELAEFVEDVRNNDPCCSHCRISPNPIGCSFMDDDYWNVYHSDEKGIFTCTQFDENDVRKGDIVKFINESTSSVLVVVHHHDCTSDCGISQYIHVVNLGI